ncbi:MAG: tyrosine-type recombinase/integrase [Anaerovoracaceae bacterium]|nr:tyrosine-type recombinase/integrase [Clostridiales bacterium]
MDKHLADFREHLEKELNKSKNTVDAYIRDLKQFEAWLLEKDVSSLVKAKNIHITGYLLYLKEKNREGSTVNRKTASLRAFYKYGLLKKLIEEDPLVHIKVPKQKEKEIQYLTVPEVEKLMALPNNSLFGIRDRAILEILYATGIRVTELAQANLSDINMRMSYITMRGDHGKARIVPIGKPAKAALEEYVYDIRPKIAKGKAEKDSPLFLNYAGKRLTRQGLWKIVKGYAKKTGLEDKITPQVLRNSFAVHMLENGADLKILQELLGHEDPARLQLLLTVSKSRIKDVYDSTHPRA